jgi:branched-subunit amino acid aminotransferase/4-amino-4-deoxychorismate lyase
MAVQLFAVTPAGARPLEVPGGAVSAHDVFDGLPLGVYSALRTFEHERFLALEMHFARTDRSLELLGWSERLDRPALARALDEVVGAFAEPEAFVRFDVLADAPAVLGTRERTLLALSPYTPVPAAYLRDGVAVRVSSLRRGRPLIKLASFVLERRPYPLGRQEAYEHLIVDGERRILEGTSSNFLAVRGGRLHMSGDDALQGVTQRIVADLAGGIGLECVREPLRCAELGEVDEAFLTSSSRGLVPVVAVEGERIGTGAPGPWTRRLTEAYYEHARTHARRAIG